MGRPPGDGGGAAVEPADSASLTTAVNRRSTVSYGVSARLAIMNFADNIVLRLTGEHGIDDLAIC